MAKRVIRGWTRHGNGLSNLWEIAKGCASAIERGGWDCGVLANREYWRGARKVKITIIVKKDQCARPLTTRKASARKARG